MTDTIERTLELDAAVEDVWRALTDPTELSGWFGDTTELNPRVGADGWFGWQQHGRFAVRVEVFEPPRRFSCYPECVRQRRSRCPPGWIA